MLFIDLGEISLKIFFKNLSCFLTASGIGAPSYQFIL